MAIGLATCSTTLVLAATVDGSHRSVSPSPQSADEVPYFYIQSRSTLVGEIKLPLVNNGVLGSQDGNTDPCFDPQDPRFYTPSTEFPRRSGVQFVYGGGLWVGAVRGTDTVIAFAVDGWVNEGRFWPAPPPHEAFEEMTTRPVLRFPHGSHCPDIPRSDLALSEHDLIVEYSDTADVYDPVGVAIRQSVHSWGSGVCADFDLIHWTVRNVSGVPLDQVYVGLFMDYDVGHITESELFQDDVMGSLTSYPSWLGDGFADSLDVFWAIDTDGDPTGSPSKFDSQSARGALGVTLLEAPGALPTASRNWWTSSFNSPYDWGPSRPGNPVEGGPGTPATDRAKYQLLSNGEFDYDQMEAAYFHLGWEPPYNHAVTDIANGFDTRGVQGFGPFTLPPDSALDLWVALVGGHNVHQHPGNYEQYWNAQAPQAFQSRLDFSDLARNALWARWFFDNPGVDTDADGYAGRFRLHDGDTVYFSGDGVPDLEGPSAPPTPAITVEAGGGMVVIRWNGRECERTRDRFSLRHDFEGYRVYVSHTGQAHEYAMVCQRDLVNFVEMQFSTADDTWQAWDVPKSIDSLKILYDSISLAEYGVPFDPLDYDEPEVSQAFRRVVPSSSTLGALDTVYSYFPPLDGNQSPDDSELARLDSLGLDVVGAIRRVNPAASPVDSVLVRDSVWTWPYFDYEFALGDFNPVMPAHVAVSAFDHGDPELGAEACESPMRENSVQVWPGGLSQLPEDGRADPGVFPNPYRVSDDYASQGWESSSAYPEDTRRLTFYNLPDTCVLTVWTMDGDLVIKIHHAGAGTLGDASREVWNLVSRNNTALRTGLYIWSVESREGNYAGKLAILR